MVIKELRHSSSCISPGRPSPEQEITAALKQLDSPDFWKLQRTEQVKKVTKVCGKEIDEKGWGSRNVQDHIVRYDRMLKKNKC